MSLPNTRGGKRRRHAPRKLSHDQTREIAVLISQGVIGKVIAARYGVGRRTIYAALARLETEEQGLGMTTTHTLRKRADIALECLPVALYREMLAKLFEEMLAHPASSTKPAAYAGVTIWLGAHSITQNITREMVVNERNAGSSLKYAAQQCIEMLAAAPQGETK